jgi:hypothetical protein
MKERLEMPTVFRDYWVGQHQLLGRIVPATGKDSTGYWEG